MEAAVGLQVLSKKHGIIPTNQNFDLAGRGDSIASQTRSALVDIEKSHFPVSKLLSRQILDTLGNDKLTSFAEDRIVFRVLIVYYLPYFLSASFHKKN